MRALPVRPQPLWRTDFRQRIAVSLWFLPSIFAERVTRDALHKIEDCLPRSCRNIAVGGLEPRALRFVREWAGLRDEEILANWERVRKNEPLLDIEPLP
jgi:hypothetical protein